jgi:hypothetical protein
VLDYFEDIAGGLYTRETVEVHPDEAEDKYNDGFTNSPLLDVLITNVYVGGPALQGRIDVGKEWDYQLFRRNYIEQSMRN